MRAFINIQKIAAFKKKHKNYLCQSSIYFISFNLPTIESEFFSVIDHLIR